MSARRTPRAQVSRAATRARRRRLSRAFVAAGLALLVAVGAAATGCAPQAPGTVVFHDLELDPQTITVPAGATVRWVNQDETAHIVQSDNVGQKGVSPSEQFVSQPLNPGQSFSHTFGSAGTFTYSDPIQAYIKGTVVVR